MHDGLDIAAHAIDQQVHGELAGRLAASAQLRPVVTHDHQIVRLKVAFAHSRGSGENAVVIEGLNDSIKQLSKTLKQQSVMP